MCFGIKRNAGAFYITAELIGGPLAVFAGGAGRLRRSRTGDAGGRAGALLSLSPPPFPLPRLVVALLDDIKSLLDVSARALEVPHALVAKKTCCYLAAYRRNLRAAALAGLQSRVETKGAASVYGAVAAGKLAFQ